MIWFFIFFSFDREFEVRAFLFLLKIFMFKCLEKRQRSSWAKRIGEVSILAVCRRNCGSTRYAIADLCENNLLIFSHSKQAFARICDEWFRTRGGQHERGNWIGCRYFMNLSWILLRIVSQGNYFLWKFKKKKDKIDKFSGNSASSQLDATPHKQDVFGTDPAVSFFLDNSSKELPPFSSPGDDQNYNIISNNLVQFSSFSELLNREFLIRLVWMQINQAQVDLTINVSAVFYE